MSLRIKILLIILFVFTISCEENFSPKEEFHEEYILNCIIRGNSNFQTVSLLRSFDVEGFNPEIDSSNRFISGAKITLQYNDTTYLFHDTTMTSLLDQNFEGPLNLYYIDNFKRNISAHSMVLQAILPNGKILTSTTDFPIEFDFDFNYQNATLYIPPEPKVNSVNVFWQPIDYSYYQYYLAKLKIYYEYEENGSKLEKFIEVPVSSKIVNGIEYLNYPKPSRSLSISYPTGMVDKAMEKILENENFSDKKRIFVRRWAKIDVLALNNDLAAYYFAGLSENPYTVRIDQISYSNVNEGYGIFGSLWIEEAQIRIQDGYIRTFGYNIAN